MRSLENLKNGQINEIRDGVSWEDYLEIDGMNPSTLVHGLRSMRHLKYSWEHSSGDSSALAWGRAVHCLLLEPSEFPRRYVACDMVRNSRHKAYQDFLADNPGKEVLTREQLDTAVEAAQSFLASSEVQELIDAGKAEVTLLTVEEGLQCKHRVDWLRTSEETLVDLKTTRNIDARRVSADFYRYHYDVKLGLYQRALQKLTGRQWPVQVIWMENVPPYDVAVMPIDDAVLDFGARKGLQVLERFRECLDADQWPGVSSEDFLLYTPTWAMDEDGVDYEGVGA